MGRFRANSIALFLSCLLLLSSIALSYPINCNIPRKMVMTSKFAYGGGYGCRNERDPPEVPSRSSSQGSRIGTQSPPSPHGGPSRYVALPGDAPPPIKA